jgi:hypothetical protein
MANSGIRVAMVGIMAAEHDAKHCYRGRCWGWPLGVGLAYERVAHSFEFAAKASAC